MSTHNLARSVIEGGRSSNWKFWVHKHKREERQATRKALRKLTRNPELWDETLIPKRNKPWYGADKFNDNVVYIHTWLDAQCGRPWDKVYSELCARYPRKRLRNWHLIEHVMQLVNLSLDDQSYCSYVVDDDGILWNDDDFERDWGRSKRKTPPLPSSWPARESSCLDDLIFDRPGRICFLAREGRFYWVKTACVHKRCKRMFTDEIYTLAYPSRLPDHARAEHGRASVLAELELLQLPTPVP